MQSPVVSWFSDRSPDDRTLFARIAAGDQHAFDQLYRRESGAVYRYALAVCGNEAWAADALQEAFLALWRGTLAFDPAKGNAAAFLCGVARHHVLALVRDRLHGAQVWEPERDEDGALDHGSDPQALAMLLVNCWEGAALRSRLSHDPAPLGAMLDFFFAAATRE
jgi:DNA-directed RNA polymerase specialized sigma24 family protein